MVMDEVSFAAETKVYPLVPSSIAWYLSCGARYMHLGSYVHAPI